MSFGLTSGVTVKLQSVNPDGTVIRRTEGVSASRITKTRQAVGVMGVKFDDYLLFKNYNYEKPLTGVEEVEDRDVLELIDKRILTAQRPELFDIQALEAEILNINNLINIFRVSQQNTTDEQELERISDELTCLAMLLEDKLSELNQVLIARGIKSTNPLITKLLSLDILGIVIEEEGTDIELQAITVSWDNIDQFVDYAPHMGTGPSDTVTFNITVETGDGEPTDRAFTVVVEVDTTMTEGLDYILTNFTMIIPAGTADGYMYSAEYEAFDDGSPANADLTLTANNGVIPVGSTANPLTVTYEAVV